MNDVQVPETTPLRVELEGELFGGDLLWEAVLHLIRVQPRTALALPAWAMGGRRVLRRRLSSCIRLDPSELPYKEEVLRNIEDQASIGRRVVLVPSDDAPLVDAEQVASVLDVFHEVAHAAPPASSYRRRIGSPRTGQPPRPARHPDIARRGPDPLGRATIPVESGADRGRRVRRDAAEVPFTPSESRGAPSRALLRELRLHQWAKNLLLAVPLVMSHRPVGIPQLALIFMAFLVFGLAASFVYVTNDLLDLPSDRRHPSKRRRPIASGQVSIGQGLGLAVGLLTSACLLALALPAVFGSLVAVYIALSSLYSFRIKRMLLLDVACLAGLYSLRLFAGAVVIGVQLSPWLLAFSMFFFLSLAFVKRYVELAACGGALEGRVPGRGYRPADLDLIRSVGPMSGYLAVLVICLFIHDPPTAALYRHPAWLWAICPTLLYWISHIWFLAQRGELHEDPVLYALRDRNSLTAGALTLAFFLAAWL